jgi:two-component system chemotaxis response regulator CheB
MPSVDVLMRSVAAAVGANSIGAILTGMGSDGAQGLLEMKQAGARTFAQDEQTSVVFGMPKQAFLCGAAEKLLPIAKVADELVRLSQEIAA